ncbi:MAG: HAMP domain-containing histidine kinase [Methanoregulaceae archaeon]|nr:HAMP domain-containing histidine kinase [Methanoregulaceae archaeon]
MKSFRTRLILSNTIVIALMSLIVGGALAWLNLSRMSASIDRELADRARSATRVRGPGPGGGGGFGGGGFGGGPGGGGFGQRGPDRPQGGPRNPFNDPIGQIRRPRILTEAGEPAGPESDVAFDPKAIPLSRAEPVYTEVTYEGELVRVYTMQFEGPDGEYRIVQSARELRDYHELRRVQTMALLFLLPLALLGAAGAGVLLSRSALRPIAALREAIAQFTEGDRSRRITVQGNDEFADLTRQYNLMADRVDQSFAAQADSYAALTQSYEQQRRFVADASHELRTPLTRIQLLAANAMEDSDSERKEALRMIHDSTQGLALLARQLLDLARADAGELKLRLEPQDLRAWVADWLAADHGVPKIELTAPDAAVMVAIDPALMGRILANIVENARRHTLADGRISIEVTMDRRLRVSDTGEGIPEADLPHVFDRFYRVDSSRTEATGGTGLGLAIVRELVRLHGGEVTIESKVGVGTTVEVSLPVPQQMSEPS